MRHDRDQSDESMHRTKDVKFCRKTALRILVIDALQ